MKLGNNLRRCRFDHDEISQEALALAVGVTRQTILSIEKGKFVPTRDFSNPQQLISILKSFKKSEFSEARQALEKIKTLNSNINMAFGRLDQLLKQIEQKIDKQ